MLGPLEQGSGRESPREARAAEGSGKRTRGDSMLSSRATIVAAIAAGLMAVVVPATASASYSVPYGNTALGDAIWNETWEPETLEGGNNGCKPSAAHPYPVVLVHATLADEGSNWVTLAPLLANNGYCVYAFNYGATLASLEVWPFIGPRIDGLNHIERSAEELRSFVNNVLSKTGRLEGRSRRAFPGRNDAQLLHQVPRRGVQGERPDRPLAEQPRHDAERADEVRRSVPVRLRNNRRACSNSSERPRCPNRSRARRSSRSCSAPENRSARACATW